MKWSSSFDTLTASVTANAMALEFNSESLKALIQMKASMSTYLRHSTYQRTRPQVPIEASPAEWWQHAVRCIGRERMNLLDRQPCTLTPSARRALRHAYIGAYLEEHGARRWMKLLPWRYRTPVKELEAQLSLQDIVRFRWWAWASMQNRSSNKELSAKLASLLDAINSRVSSSAVGSFSHSRLEIHCPRVSFIFSTHKPPAASHMSSASSLAAQAHPSVAFELHLRELHARKLSCSLAQEEIATGSMRTACSASIAGLIFREAEAVQHQSDFESVLTPGKPPGHHVLPALPAWLVMSPALDAEADHLDAFVRLQYRLPVLASEPTQCSLRFGALDAIYCQKALLHFASFFDKAWPAPDLDPLAIRASVSLREVVQDSLQHAELDTMETQTFPEMQVNAGGVRILLPCIKKQPHDRPSDAPLDVAHGHLPEQGPVGLSFSSRQPAVPLAEQAIGVLVLTLGNFKISSDAFARLQADVHAQGPLITAGQQSTGGADEDARRK
ncbi:g9668 [Coccomyxa elongata]